MNSFSNVLLLSDREILGTVESTGDKSDQVSPFNEARLGLRGKSDDKLKI